jgi:hypothetical protein
VTTLATPTWHRTREEKKGGNESIIKMENEIDRQEEAIWDRVSRHGRTTEAIP